MFDLQEAFAPPPPANSARHEGWRDALGARLDPIAAKIAPTMSVSQGEAWRRATTDALSDLPAMIGLTAAKRALHRPMLFISEVETVIRGIAEEVSADRREAIARIERLLAALRRAAEPALPSPVEEVDPTETAALIAGVNDPGLKRILRGIAEAAGWLPEEGPTEGREAA